MPTSLPQQGQVMIYCPAVFGIFPRPRFRKTTFVAFGSRPTLAARCPPTHGPCDYGVLGIARLVDHALPDDLQNASAGTLMRRHHEIYRELDAEAKAALARRAGQLSGMKVPANLQEALTKLSVARADRAQRASKLPGVPNTVDACRYDDGMVLRFLELYTALESCSSRWTLEPDRIGCPGVPEIGAQEAIVEDIKRLFLSSSPGRPWWASIVCQRREAFVNSALVFQRSEDDEIDGPALLPLHLCQRLDTVYFLRAPAARGVALASLQEALALSSQPLESFSWMWHIDTTSFGQSMLTAAGGFDDDAAIYVFPHVVFAGRFVLARGDAIPFDEYILGLPRVKAPSKSKASKTGVATATPDNVAKIREEYPWFTEDDITSALKAACVPSERRARGSRSGGSSGDRREVAIVPLGEDAAAEAVAELQAHRNMWQWEAQDEVHHFYVQARGGASTKARFGTATDCVAVFARAHVKSWCRMYSCDVMRSFALSKHISEHICHVLAREWCAKQNHYYQAWLDAGQLGNFDFASVAKFRFPDSFYAALEEVPATSPTFARFQELSQWEPIARSAAM